MRPTRHLLAALATAVLLPAFAQAAEPAVFPAQPLRLVVPAETGSRADVLARVLATGLSARLGQPVGVDNMADRAGAFAAVAAAAPDGHTLLLGGDSLLAGLAQPHVAYELKSYTPVALATRSAQVPAAEFLPAAHAAATVSGSQGVLAPAGTPGTVVKRLHQAIAQVLEDPANRASLGAAGFEVVAGSPAAYSAELLRGLGSWTRIARASAPLAQ